MSEPSARAAGSSAGSSQGRDGVAVVAHGRSDARAIKNAIRVTRDAVQNQLVGKIRAEVGK